MRRWTYDDGGRKAAGYWGTANDCVVRAITIATQTDYQTTYDALNEAAKAERPRRGSKRSSSRTGVSRVTFRKHLAELAWDWTPTMGIGTGCRVHLRASELPAGRLIVSVSRHIVAVIDGVIHDIADPARRGTRCVYGYWSEPEADRHGITPADRARTQAFNNVVHRSTEKRP